MKPSFILIGVHRSAREVLVWTGAAGFVPITRAKEGAPPQAREISGDVAERLMSQITKHKTQRKYEFILVPLLKLSQVKDPEASGLILPPSLH